MPLRTGRCFPKILLHLGGCCFSRKWSRRHELGRRLRDRTHENTNKRLCSNTRRPFCNSAPPLVVFVSHACSPGYATARHNGDPTLINHCIHQPGARACFSGPLGGREKMSHHRPDETKPRDTVRVFVCVINNV